MVAIIATEQGLGHLPRDVSEENLGYDVESLIPAEGNAKDKLHFIEVKGRIRGAPTVTITKNEILTAFNKPEDWMLALVEVRPPRTSPKGMPSSPVSGGRATARRPAA
jgi:hypothetical protein